MTLKYTGSAYNITNNIMINLGWELQAIATREAELTTKLKQLKNYKEAIIALESYCAESTTEKGVTRIINILTIIDKEYREVDNI